MKRNILVLTTLLTACGGQASLQPAKAPDCADKVVTEKVPVVQPWPVPPKISRPKMPSTSIPPMAIKNKDYATINNYLEADVQTLYGYIDRLESALKPYYTPPVIQTPSNSGK